MNARGYALHRVHNFPNSDVHVCLQALAGEVGMSNELDDVSRSLYNGMIPTIWRKLAPATLKQLGNWMSHFQNRFAQYSTWVSQARSMSIKKVR